MEIALGRWVPHPKIRHLSICPDMAKVDVWTEPTLLALDVVEPSIQLPLDSIDNTFSLSAVDDMLVRIRAELAT